MTLGRAYVTYLNSRLIYTSYDNNKAPYNIVSTNIRIISKLIKALIKAEFATTLIKSDLDSKPTLDLKELNIDLPNIIKAAETLESLRVRRDNLIRLSLNYLGDKDSDGDPAPKARSNDTY